MRTPISVRMTAEHYRLLHNHLFPGDHDEHGAVLSLGSSETNRGTRLLVRDVFLAEDGVDYVPGTRGYRALTASFVGEKASYCAREKLGYLAVHCHGGRDTVAFSGDDMASHERGYPALLQITQGLPVGALVFAESAVAGDIWTEGARQALASLHVVGTRTTSLFPAPRSGAKRDPTYDRQARLFGDRGQEILSGLKVGIIGLGGGGSLLNEWLSRLGVGHIVGVDCDRVDLTNLPRIVAATQWDARAFLQASSWALLRKLGQRLAAYKVTVGRRVAKQANPRIRYDAIVGNIVDEEVALGLRDADFILLAADSFQARLVFTALVNQYLIPGVQVGVKIPVDPGTGDVGTISVSTRPVLPGANNGCLSCHGLIPALRLQNEAVSEEERRAQRYVDDEDVTAPSVITLNVQSAVQAANDLMMMFTGLYNEGVELVHHQGEPRDRRLRHVGPTVDPSCSWCGSQPHSHFGRGDSVRLPCRLS